MTTDWLSAIGMLLAGLVVGFMFVYAAMRRKEEAHDDLDRRDLEAKRDALIAQLRADDLADDERARIEREAADVLRALDVTPSVSEGPGREGRAPAAQIPRSARNDRSSSAVGGFLWGAGTVVALFFIGWFVTKNATPKDQPPQQQQAAPMQQPQEIQQLETQVKNNPDDNDLRISLAKAYLDRENLMGVFEQTSAVLAKNPNEPRAQTYQAIVRMSMGQPVEAKKLLDSATTTDPKLVDAWVALAWLRAQQGDSEGMTQAIESAIKQHPEEEQRLRMILSQMQQRSSAASSSGGQAPPPVQSNGPAVHVTIDLSPGARTTGVLYLMARDAGQTAGPPAAVKRIEATNFPINVDLTAGDSMMGTPLPSKMRVEARLDGDGNVMTKDPSDPKAAQDNVALGATVTLKLQ